MILLITTIEPRQPVHVERLSACGATWIAYFLTLALVIGWLA